MLAEGLSGVALGASLEAARIAYAPTSTHSAPSICISPLLTHLEKVVEEVLQAAHGENSREIGTLGSQANKIKSLTFALASSVGAGWLDSRDEDVLWQLSANLMVRLLLLPRQIKDTKINFSALEQLSSSRAFF